MLTGGSSSTGQGNAVEVAYPMSLRMDKSMLGGQRLARLWMNPPGVSACLLALALSTSSRTPQRPNMAIPWPSYNGQAKSEQASWNLSSHQSQRVMVLRKPPGVMWLTRSCLTSVGLDFQIRTEIKNSSFMIGH